MNNPEKFWNWIASKSAAKLSVNDSKLLGLLSAHLSAGQNVLDIGCGPGQISIEIAKKVKKVLGVDTAKAMIKVAHDLAVEQNVSNVEFVSHSLSDSTAFESSSYDVITAFNMLHYLPNPSIVLRSLHEMLKPNGLLVSSTACFNEGTQLIGQFMKFGARLNLIPKAELYTFSGLASLIEEGGFIIEERHVLSDVQAYYLVARKV